MKQTLTLVRQFALTLLLFTSFSFSSQAQDFDDSEPIMEDQMRKVLLLQFENLDKKPTAQAIKAIWDTAKLIDNDDFKKELSEFLLVSYCSIGKFKTCKKHAKAFPKVRKVLKGFYTNCETCQKLKEYKCKIGKHCRNGMQLNLATGKKHPCPSCHKRFKKKCKTCKKRVRYFSRKKAKDYVAAKSAALQRIIVNNNAEEFLAELEARAEDNDA